MTDPRPPSPLEDDPARRGRSGADRDRRPDPAAPRESDEDAVDEELENTFPASDPPARNGTT